MVNQEGKFGRGLKKRSQKVETKNRNMVNLYLGKLNKNCGSVVLGYGLKNKGESD